MLGQAGCEFSAGLGPNASGKFDRASEKNCVILVRLIDYSGKLPFWPVKTNTKFAAWSRNAKDIKYGSGSCLHGIQEEVGTTKHNWSA